MCFLCINWFAVVFFISISRIVQQVKDISNTKAALNFAAANKIQAEYDNLIALKRLRDEILTDMERIVVLLQANQRDEVISITGGKQSILESLN